MRNETIPNHVWKPLSYQGATFEKIKAKMFKCSLCNGTIEVSKNGKGDDISVEYLCIPKYDHQLTLF